MLGGQQAWHDHAAQLATRMEHMQVNVWPDALFAVCSSCGWMLEAPRAHQPRFRYSVATHECRPVEDSPRPAADLVPDALF